MMFFWQKCLLWTAAIGVVKASVDVEREHSKKEARAQFVTANLLIGV